MKIRSAILVIWFLPLQLVNGLENHLDMSYAQKRYSLEKIETNIRISRQRKSASLVKEADRLVKKEAYKDAFIVYREASKYYAGPVLYYKYGRALLANQEGEKASKALNIAQTLYEQNYARHHRQIPKANLFFAIARAYAQEENHILAFKYLELAYLEKFSNFRQVYKLVDFTSLRKEPEFKQQMARIQNKRLRISRSKIPGLIKVTDSESERLDSIILLCKNGQLISLRKEDPCGQTIAQKGYWQFVRRRLILNYRKECRSILVTDKPACQLTFSGCKTQKQGIILNRYAVRFLFRSQAPVLFYKKPLAHLKKSSDLIPTKVFAKGYQEPQICGKNFQPKTSDDLRINFEDY